MPNTFFAGHVLTREAHQTVKDKHPTKVAVVVACESNMTPLAKRKFLVSRDLTLAQFMLIVRNRTQLQPEEALFVFVDNTLPPLAATMGLLDKQFADRNTGFLLLTVAVEATFGGWSLI